MDSRIPCRHSAPPPVVPRAATGSAASGPRGGYWLRCQRCPGQLLAQFGLGVQLRDKHLLTSALRHQRLYLLHRARDDGETLHAVLSDDDIVLDPDAAEAAVRGDHLRHEEATELRVRLRLVQQMVDEVAAGLDGEHHVRL